MLHRLSDDTRLVVSEPLGDLRGAWREADTGSFRSACRPGGGSHDGLTLLGTALNRVVGSSTDGVNGTISSRPRRITTHVGSGTGRACFDVPDHLLSASAGAAARHGLDALLVDPRSGDLRRGRELLHMLVRHVAPALEAAGDLRVVTALLAHRLRRGSDAARQRTLRRTHDRAGFVQALSEATVVVDGLT